MNEELEQKQVKNIRNKVRDIVNKADSEVIVKLGMMLSIDVPLNLKDKYEREQNKE